MTCGTAGAASSQQLNAVIAISGEIHDELVGYGVPESKVATIPNGVDDNHFYPPNSAEQRRELRKTLQWPDRPTILISGVLVLRKRPRLLIEALAVLRSRGVDCQLVLAGPAKEEGYAASLRQLIAERNLASDVIFAGFVDDMAPLYRAADIFSLPSANEGMLTRCWRQWPAVSRRSTPRFPASPT